MISNIPITGFSLTMFSTIPHVYYASYIVHQTTAKKTFTLAHSRLKRAASTQRQNTHKKLQLVDETGVKWT
jgi:hypothetical protein